MSIDSIQNRLLSSLLCEYIPERTEHFAKFITAFSPSVIKDLGSILKIEESTKDAVNKMGEQIFESVKDQVVLIFDDMERCSIDVVELMGYLNNLCENNGYRVVIIANEKEITVNKSFVSDAIIRHTNAIVNLCENGAFFNEGQVSSVETNGEDTKTKECDRSGLVELPIEHNNLYERTKEKLIGLTVHYETDIADIYDDVLRKTIPEMKDGSLKKYKDTIIHSFKKMNCKNIRTLISVFLAAEKIISPITPDIPEWLKAKCDKYEVQTDCIIEEEKQTIIDYITTSAINNAEGNPTVDWGYNRYGRIESSDAYGLVRFGYAFVDEYWATLVPDSQIINRDFSSKIIDVLTETVNRSRDSHHKDLALFKLQLWYLDDDKTVIENIDLLKQELKEKKYYPSEFKEIILLLMKLNNNNSGMITSPEEVSKRNSVFEVFVDSIPEENHPKKTPAAGNYVKWPPIDIKEYVDLMLNRLDPSIPEIDKDMFSLITDDVSFAREYKELVQPILNKIDEFEINRIKKHHNGDDLFSDVHTNYYESIKKNRDSYISNHCFLSLVGIDKLNAVVCEGDVVDIYNLLESIKTVYNFCNIRDFFKSDYSAVDKLWQCLKRDREEGGKVYNSSKSRTREIALRKLEYNLCLYRKNLMST